MESPLASTDTEMDLTLDNTDSLTPAANPNNPTDPAWLHHDRNSVNPIHDSTNNDDTPQHATPNQPTGHDNQPADPVTPFRGPLPIPPLPPHCPVNSRAFDPPTGTQYHPKYPQQSQPTDTEIHQLRQQGKRRKGENGTIFNLSLEDSINTARRRNLTDNKLERLFLVVIGMRSEMERQLTRMDSIEKAVSAPGVTAGKERNQSPGN